MMKRNASLPPVYMDILHPYALIYLVVDTLDNTWMKPDNEYILKHMRENKCGLYNVLNYFLQTNYHKLSFIGAMLFPDSNIMNKLECCAFSWLLSRLLIGDNSIMGSAKNQLTTIRNIVAIAMTETYSTRIDEGVS
jgi:hypothetical protein